MRCVEVWPLSSVMVTGSKGDPEAKMTRPSVHLNACSAVHSLRCVGFDMAKMLWGVFECECVCVCVCVCV